jgi:hypothetical protein
VETIQSRITDLVETDIHWVLTVPAIWKDNAKQFMREAAQLTRLTPRVSPVEQGLVTLQEHLS